MCKWQCAEHTTSILQANLSACELQLVAGRFRVSEVMGAPEPFIQATLHRCSKPSVSSTANELTEGELGRSGRHFDLSGVDSSSRSGGVNERFKEAIKAMPIISVASSSP